MPYGSVLETPVSDETLSIQGAFADSKAVGDKFKEVKTETGSLKEDLGDIDYLYFKDKINKLTFNSEGGITSWKAVDAKIGTDTIENRNVRENFSRCACYC